MCIRDSQLGFQFEVLNQAEALLPKHKKTVLPIVMKYYALAKNPAEKSELLRWLHHKGFEEAVPMLLADYCSDRTPDTTRWFISVSYTHLDVYKRQPI